MRDPRYDEPQPPELQPELLPDDDFDPDEEVYDGDDLPDFGDEPLRSAFGNLARVR